MRDEADGKKLESKLPAFVQKYVMLQIADAVGGDTSYAKFRANANIGNIR